MIIFDNRLPLVARAQVVSLLATTSPFAVPLWRAASEGLLSLVVPDRAASPSALRRALAGVAGPMTILIGDDDEAPTGPSGWRCARAAIESSGAALVHGAAGEEPHYRTAALVALLAGRALLIETDSRHAQQSRHRP